MNLKTLISLAIFVVLCSGINDVIVKDQKIFVDEWEFFIKGIAYHPTPKAYPKAAGLCSLKRTPYDDYVSACQDSDFWDGAHDAEREPPPPEGGWFEGMWKRDFPLLKEAGANTIRLYSANPITRLATEENLGTHNIVVAKGKDHRLFMDYAAAYDMKVIFPLIGDENILRTFSSATVEWMLRNQIDEVGNHSALLMYTFGNELPIAQDAELRAIVSEKIHYIRSYQEQKWSRKIPITVAVVDYPYSYNNLTAELPVDVFTANAGYRGFTFQDLWKGRKTPTVTFDGFYKLSCIHRKPLLIGEIGWHMVNDSATYRYPDWFNQIWKDLVRHIDQGAVGGVFFEFNDEPTKALDQQTMGIVKFEIACDATGCGNQSNVWVPDIAIKKDIIWNAVCCGTYQGVPFNMNADVWTLLNRSRLHIAESCSTCLPAWVQPGDTPCNYTSYPNQFTSLASTYAVTTTSNAVVTSTNSVTASTSMTVVATTEATTTQTATTSSSSSAAVTSGPATGSNNGLTTRTFASSAGGPTFASTGGPSTGPSGGPTSVNGPATTGTNNPSRTTTADSTGEGNSLTRTNGATTAINSPTSGSSTLYASVLLGAMMCVLLLL